MTDARWDDLIASVALGEHRVARIVRVERWGALVDLGLEFPGFIDSLHLGDDIEAYRVDDEWEVEVIQFAEYNNQIRVRPVTGRAGCH